MLHKWMDMQVFLYGMTAAGLIGAGGMLVIHLTYRRKVRSMHLGTNLKEKWMGLWKSRDQLMHRMNQWVCYPALLCAFFMGTALLLTARLQMEGGLPMGYVYTGVGVPLGLLLLRQVLDFSYKEELLVDALADYIDRAKSKLQEMPSAAADPGLRGEVVEQIARSIKESAAAGSRFSGLLSPEEERLMREIIREFMD